MKLSINGNSNYTATVTTIKNIIPLENCDSICHSIIFGNYVIVSKDVQVGDVGIFFPVETKLSSLFLSSNNLYRNKELNSDKTKAEYFEDSGRIKCLRMRGNRSEGLFIPLTSLFAFISDVTTLHALEEGSSFDTVEGVTLCEKYVVYNKHVRTGNRNEKKSVKKISRIKSNQFRLHISTENLGRNIHKLKPENYIDLSVKCHGTSMVIGNILCNRELNWYEKILKKIGIKIEDSYYDTIYSSRKVIKNQFINKNATHYYSEDIWGVVANEIKHLIPKNITIYGEIVGYLSDNREIQKDYDYGCEKGKHDFYVYRMTSTNSDGDVIELPMIYVREWCKLVGIKVVPQLYYGSVIELFSYLWLKHSSDTENNVKIKRKYGVKEYNSDLFLDLLYKEYLDKKCTICKNDCWAEGIVIRVENSLDIEVFKNKSPLFLEKETKNLDKGEENIEDNQE